MVIDGEEVALPEKKREKELPRGLDGEILIWSDTHSHSAGTPADSTPLDTTNQLELFS